MTAQPLARTSAPHKRCPSGACARRLRSCPARVALRGRRRGETPRTPSSRRVSSLFVNSSRTRSPERLHTQTLRRWRPRQPQTPKHPTLALTTVLHASGDALETSAALDASCADFHYCVLGLTPHTRDACRRTQQCTARHATSRPRFFAPNLRVPLDRNVAST